MNDELKSILYNKGVDIVRFVDISEFPINQTQGFSKAILFCIGLSKKLLQIYTITYLQIVMSFGKRGESRRIS